MRLVWLVAAWFAGIALSEAIGLLPWQWLSLAGVALLGALLSRRLPRYRALLSLLLSFFLGAARYESARPALDANHIATYRDSGRSISLIGTVVSPPERRETYVALRVEARSLAEREGVPGRPVHGLVLVHTSSYERWAYGDLVAVRGRLESPPIFESFSYQEYLARHAIYVWMPRAEATRLARRSGSPILQAVNDYRALALQRVELLFPEPEASLFAGILLGEDSQIRPSIREAFNRTGTSHIIAISGFNLTIIASVFLSLFGRWLGVRRGALLAALAIAFYTLLVGASASVVRAAIMAWLAILARRLGRQSDGLASLAFASGAMTLINPFTLWDIGFQLSVAATLGLILYTDPLRAWSQRILTRWLKPSQAERLADPLSEFVLFSLAAQVTTLPLIAFYFQRVSLISLLANPIVLPAQPALMILGGLAVLLASLWTPIGQLLAWLAWPFAAFTIRFVELFSTWPSASSDLGDVAPALVAGWYLALFALTAILRVPPERRPRLIGILSSIRIPHAPVLIVLAALSVFLWRQLRDRPDGLLRISILDVGAGEAVLVETPHGRSVLIGGGPSPTALAEGLGRRLPLVERRLDWVVIGGSSDDKIAGLLGVFGRARVGAVLLGAPSGGAAYRQLLRELEDCDCAVHHAEVGQALELGEGARLEVLALGERGAALLLSWRNASFLLAPGADPSLVRALSLHTSTGAVTAALLPDGGAEAVNPREWLSHIDPLVALISVEADGPRGLPSPEVLQALSRRTLLRTDLNGWIELTTDGTRLWIEAERSSESRP